jgi:hypothetical protein
LTSRLAPHEQGSTYFVEDMDKLSPEEYREALMQKVMDSAERRRSSGNRDWGTEAASNYMEGLTSRKKAYYSRQQPW